MHEHTLVHERTSVHRVPTARENHRFDVLQTILTDVDLLDMPAYQPFFVRMLAETVVFQRRLQTLEPGIDDVRTGGERLRPRSRG